MRTVPIAHVLLALPILASCTGLARANDSSAEYAMGGVRFLKDNDIAMESEDLSISTGRIDITYRFVNRSSQPKTVTMAFPMPDIDGSGDREEIALPTENADNIFDFQVTADGTPIKLELSQKVLVRGVDRTEPVKAAKLPMLPSSNATDAALDKLPKATKDEFVRLGLAQIDTEDAGKGEETHYTAAWTLRSTFTWSQTFPPNQPVTLKQTYKPSVGSSAQTSIGGDGWRQDPDIVSDLKKYCIDDDIIRTIAREREAKKAAYPTYYEQRIAYILKTGANWAGPIGDFHLTVDKGEAKNLVSFCADDVQKTGPTRFEVHKTNFTPKTDLDILILVPLG